MERWKRVFRRWAETEEHQEAVRRAREIVNSAVKRAKRPYVAWSGGKDSTCVLSLVLEQVPDVMVLHWDYGRYYIPRWLFHEIKDNARAIGVQNLRIETSSEYERLGRHAINVLGREYLGKLVPELRKEGFDLVFLGLRAEESVKRRLRTRGGIWREKGMWACSPIYHWSWRDVWAFIFSRCLPYPSVYDKYADVLGLRNVRLVTFFDSEFEKFGNPELDGVLMWRDKHIR